MKMKSVIGTLVFASALLVTGCAHSPANTAPALAIKSQQFKGKLEEALQAVSSNTDLEYLSITESLSAGQTQTLAGALKGHTSLKAISFQPGEMGDLGLQTFIPVIQANPSLHNLSIPANKIGPVGAAALASALKHQASLQTLELPGNTIGDAGTQDLTQALSAHSKIGKLDLEWNRIGPKGAQAVAALLKTHPSIWNLRLGINELKEQGVAAIASALGESSSGLAEISLMNTGISDTGVKAIASALAHNTHLRRLYLNNNQKFGSIPVMLNHIGDAGLNALADTLRQNSTLNALNLEGGTFTKAAEKNVWIAVLSNPNSKIILIHPLASPASIAVDLDKLAATNYYFISGSMPESRKAEQDSLRAAALERWKAADYAF